MQPDRSPEREQAEVLDLAKLWLASLDRGVPPAHPAVVVRKLAQGVIAAVERERQLTRALAAIANASPVSDDAVTVSTCFYRVRGMAREALAGGVSAAGRPPEQDLGGNAVARAEEVPDAPWEFVQDDIDLRLGRARVFNARNELVCETTPEYADVIVCAVGFMLNTGGGTAAVAEALQPFASFAEHAVEPSGDAYAWKAASWGRERISDWMGPSDFGRAAAALTAATALPAVPEVLPEETRP